MTNEIHNNIKKGKVLIKSHSQLGTNTVVLPDVTIWEGVAVGALSLVKSDLDSWYIYGGVPAIKIKPRQKGLLNFINDSSKRVKVSVCMITYGHESYIEEAIQGVLMQEGNLDVELIIADDCSPDNTFKLVDKIKLNHPKGSWIHYTRHKQNKGMIPNFIWALEQCKGKYIALCEGDDYWTDPLKLQKQVDFLEANDDYVICFHKVKILKSNGQIVDDFITKVPEHYETIETLAKYGNYIHTPSVVFKNIIKEYPVEFNEVPFGDYFLYMLLAQHGYIKCLNEAMSVYRVGVGVISKMTGLDIANNNVKLYSCMVSVLDDHKLKKIIYKKQLDVVTSHYLEIEEKLKLMEEKYNSLKLVQSNYFVSNHTFFRLLKKMITKCKTFKRKLHQLIKLR